MKTEVPEALMTCSPAPEVPPQDATQRDVALFTLDLWNAHGDCEARLGALRGFLQAE